MGHIAADSDRMTARVRRIAGQVAAIERAIAADAPCATTIHLVAAVRGAVAGLMDELVEEHLREHVAAQGLSDAERIAGADELATVLKRHFR
ncbi:metal/formaldehyde-sensitive transcriptional repressor [Sphingomonas sp. S1-29]|uniref:metal/formaldehyde-sensitive transcriptional repressor n=1 Tax=Sphingomonas sp. S1-29 TaxID=2991074 RepID=UPI0022405F36|nr:metal/formaldehyde-sensitive transcriptional repressor [Sphingomonas sp. S1-29]UZK69425.1 metal/formaldehyde-sensitive transcriptional repressor [Sphingomonas sp. S1-29]